MKVRIIEVDRGQALRGLAWAALLAVSLSMPACLLFASEATDDDVVECFVTVRNPEVVAEQGAEVPEEDLFSRAEPFLDADGSAERLYTLGSVCSGAFESLESAAEDWSRFARARIDELGEAGDPESVFGRFPGAWCAVPETLRCQEAGEQLEFCEDEQLVPLDGPPLPTCEPPPPSSACLGSECGGASPCSAVDFGDVPLGQRATETVTLSNCGDAAGTALELGVVGPPDPIGERSDFLLPDEANSCHPVNGDNESVFLDAGETCSFEVEFVPLEPGEHRAEITYPSNVQPERHRLDLFGSSTAGALEFGIVDLEGALPPEELGLCFNAPADPCTPERHLRVTNTGAGGVVVTSIRIEDPNGDTGFELSPEVEAAAPTVLSAGEVLDVAIRWCGAPPEMPSFWDLVVDATEPPTFVLRVGRAASCPDGT